MDNIIYNFCITGLIIDVIALIMINITEFKKAQKKKYKLILFQRKTNEQIVYAKLSKKEVAMILSNIYKHGANNHKIKLSNGEKINVQIIDCLNTI